MTPKPDRDQAAAEGQEFVPDLDKTLLTVMVPTAPRSTASVSPTEPSHVPMTVTLRQLASWLKRGDVGRPTRELWDDVAKNVLSDEEVESNG